MSMEIVRYMYVHIFCWDIQGFYKNVGKFSTHYWKEGATFLGCFSKRQILCFEDRQSCCREIASLNQSVKTNSAENAVVRSIYQTSHWIFHVDIKWRLQFLCKTICHWPLINFWRPSMHGEFENNHDTRADMASTIHMSYLNSLVAIQLVSCQLYHL